MNSIPTYDQPEVELPQLGTWPAAVHRFDDNQVAALRAAEAAGRPLLVRGLPGVGKSQLARAAALATGRRFVSTVIDGRTEAQDLMWQFDAVKRLAESQANGATLQAPIHYITPGPLWAAFDWAGAKQRFEDAGFEAPDWMTEKSNAAADDKVVMLLDEIDKADPDLPNALLEVLANDGFSINVAGATRVSRKDGQRPLIIITTNEERELPPAFLRRCFVITLALHTDAAALETYLVDLGERHQKYMVKAKLRTANQQCEKAVLERAADLLLQARADADSNQEYKPATAEYLDLTRAVATLYPGDTSLQLQKLDELQGYVLNKTLQAKR
jgi:MoxR-like ATPase